MELRHLKYFIAVASDLSFRKASRRLGISQPPLSRQIHMLEEELDVPLFERKGRGIALTDAGRFFKEGAESIVADAELLARRTRLVGIDSVRSIKIACVGSVMYSFFPDLLAFLKERKSDLRFDIVELSSADQARALDNGEIDLGFLRDWAESERIRFIPLGEESLAVIYPTALRVRTSPEELSSFKDEPFVSGSSPKLFGRIAEACARAGFSPRVEYECEQFTSVVKLVAAGLGWSIVPTFALRRIAIEGIRLLTLPDTVVFGAACREGPLPPIVADILERSKAFIEEYIGA